VDILSINSNNQLLKRRFGIVDLKGVNGMGRKIEIDEKERLKKHMLLDKLMDGCYIEPITKGFYCKKCDCIVQFVLVLRMMMSKNLLL
jgi:hypothetical protein